MDAGGGTVRVATCGVAADVELSAPVPRCAIGRWPAHAHGRHRHLASCIRICASTSGFVARGRVPVTGRPTQPPPCWGSIATPGPRRGRVAVITASDGWTSAVACARAADVVG